MTAFPAFAALSAVVAAFLPPAMAAAEDVDMVAIFAEARQQGRTGIAQKTRPVDARPAASGEVIVTIIRNDGVETRSKPAETGDFVVRNRCPATGNEEYLVAAAKFADRYAAQDGAAPVDGWTAYVPKGVPMAYFIIPAGNGPYDFTAPWGERMVARAGDAIVQNPADTADTYRVAAASFDCTYQIVTPAR
ncbi:hypothetical protein [Paracoccus pacificus]|uniref:Uncharacterized protein n=1 Tax=Paracoccus pacificus TaxID=1463598 RepID=A0ABW4R9I0_9RHOB